MSAVSSRRSSDAIAGVLQIERDALLPAIEEQMVEAASADEQRHRPHGIAAARIPRSLGPSARPQRRSQRLQSAHFSANDGAQSHKQTSLPLEVSRATLRCRRRLAHGGPYEAISEPRFRRVCDDSCVVTPNKRQRNLGR
jgi:hypothetical protein